MANRKNNKNSLMYIVIAIIILALATIFGEGTENQFLARNNQDSQNINNEVAQLENTEIIEGENLVVCYLDVGQADSILLQNNGQTMLIDAGTNEMGTTVVKYLQDIGVTKIDYLIGTHPHEDHIGGLDDVINNFEIGTIYMPKVQTNTKTFESVLDAIDSKNLKITSPNVGDSFNLGNAKCEIMSCGTGSKEEQSNLNLSSIVIRVVYGEQSFLFTGDAEKENEEARTWPQTNVLKVRTSRLRHKLITRIFRTNKTRNCNNISRSRKQLWTSKTNYNR